MDVDPREFRRTMGLFATGVTVITARADNAGDVVHGMTANSVTSVSLDPLLVLVCIDNRARMRELIAAAGRFAINILSDGQQGLSRHFAGRKLPDTDVAFVDLEGVPTLPGSLAALVCTVDRLIEAGDHVVVFGRVDALSDHTGGERPLIYFAGAYREITVGGDAVNPIVHDFPYVF